MLKEKENTNVVNICEFKVHFIVKNLKWFCIISFSHRDPINVFFYKHLCCKFI